MQTKFDAQCDILSKVWTDYRDDKDFGDFVEYNDLGLPLAYFISEGIALPTQLAETYIGETFNLLLAALDVDDIGYTTLEEIFDQENK